MQSSVIVEAEREELCEFLALVLFRVVVLLLQRRRKEKDTKDKSELK